MEFVLSVIHVIFTDSFKLRLTVKGVSIVFSKLVPSAVRFHGVDLPQFTNIRCWNKLILPARAARASLCVPSLFVTL